MPNAPHARGRAGAARRKHARGRIGAILGVFAVLVAAGMLFVTSAETANGTQLRTDPSDAVGLLRAEQVRYDERASRVKALQAEVDSLTQAEAADDSQVAGLQASSAKLLQAVGLQAVNGPGVVVTLNDAPRNGPMPPGVKADDLVVHQQDVQAVVNALWAGGAEALQLMDQRVISTSAVRCVGNTLILQGRVYSPPYRITAIGPIDRMLAAIATSPEIDIYQQYVRALGLGWALQQQGSITLPAYSGSLELRYATVGAGSGGTSTATPGDRTTPPATSGSGRSRPSSPATTPAP